MIKVAVVDSLSDRLGSADQAKRAANHRHELLDSRQHWRQSIWHLLGVYITRCTWTGHHLLCHAGGSWLRYGTCIRKMSNGTLTLSVCSLPYGSSATLPAERHRWHVRVRAVGLSTRTIQQSESRGTCTASHCNAGITGTERAVRRVSTLVYTAQAPRNQGMSWKAAV